MSHTYHHNAPKKGKLFRFADKYTGWAGEDCFRQNGRRFVKRTNSRHNRRAWKNSNND